MTASSIAPIATSYAGCRFRSRLEARWAVVFDHLDIRWEYESQGYQIGDVRYLPDFLLPDIEDGIFVEVKGVWSIKDFVKVMAATEIRPVLLVGDIPRPKSYGPHFEYLEGNATDKTRVSRITCSRVSLMPICSGSHVLMPCDWPLFLRDAESTHKWIDACVSGVGRCTGWVRPETSVADAFAAGRSARFEYGECG